MRRWTWLVAVLSVLALVAAACAQEAAEETTTTTTAAETTTTTEATTTTAAETTTTAAEPELVGVTEEPCPGGNPDNGCIYLGVLTDETGPFRGAAPALYAGQQLFWAAVNAEGGIGGSYDVALPENLKKDTQYLEDVFVTQYAQIADEVAAIAQSLGTPPTLAAIDEYLRDNTVAAPMSWWSGYAFAEAEGPGDFRGDQGLIVEFGTNYCFEAMNAVDWATVAIPAATGREFATAGILAYPTDYGFDYAAGVQIGAEANGIEVLWSDPVLPVAITGAESQPEALARIASDPVDIVFLSVGPFETAQIVAGAAVQLGESVPLFIGSGPTWNRALLASDAAPVFETGIYFQSSFVPGWDYDSPGHAKMRATVDAAGLEANDFFVAGWTSQYGLKQVLENAFAAGDLTKAGIAAAALALDEVDYEEMMISRTFQGDPNEIFPRWSVIGRYSAESTTGMETITGLPGEEPGHPGFFIGPTAAAFEFTEACSMPG